MRVWDLHCHLSSLPGRTPHERMAALIEYADRMGIERLLVFMGWPFKTDPSAAELRRQNDQVLEALSHWHDRALGLAYVSPRHVEASLSEIERCVVDGPMVGIKLWVAQRAGAPSLDPLVERVEQIDGLIFQHTWLKSTGNLPGESTPDDLAELARRHPQARFVCGHAGGDWQRGIRAVRAVQNVWLGLGGFDPTAGVVEMAVRELGADRVLFGSDAGGRSFASQLGKVMGAAISDEARQKILGENLRELLRPILRRKGMGP